MPLRVVQITDLHLLANANAELYGVNTTCALKQVVLAIDALPTQPDLIIVTGDIAETGTKAEYQQAQELLACLKIPVFVLPGNHDDVANMEAAFDEPDFHYRPSVQFGNWGFIFINSQVVGDSHGLVNRQSIQQLTHNITAMADCYIVVALHHPPANICPSSGCCLNNGPELTVLLNQHANIKAVISGHTHDAAEINAGNHTQYTTPSTFSFAKHAQLGDVTDHEDFWAAHTLDGSIHGFRTLDLYADGSIQSQVHWLENSALKHG